MSVDVGLQYQIDPNKVPILFEKYRRGVDEITRIFIRNMIRDAFVDLSSQMRAEDIIGVKRTELSENVEERVRNLLVSSGINVKNVSMISAIRMPTEFEKVLNEKNTASQRALQRENEVSQRRAEAQMEIERARGVAESVRIQALAEAESINIRGEALRKNPEMLQLESIQKWDGKLPQTMIPNSTTPFVNLNPQK
jgi:regulator of protease activity HflC (stomatin/prohibitin superfamily)